MSTGQENERTGSTTTKHGESPASAHVDPSIREGETKPGGTNGGMSPAGAHVDPSGSTTTTSDTGSGPTP